MVSPNCVTDGVPGQLGAFPLHPQSCWAKVENPAGIVRTPLDVATPWVDHRVSTSPIMLDLNPNLPRHSVALSASPSLEATYGLEHRLAARVAINPHCSELADEAVRSTSPIQGARK